MGTPAATHIFVGERRPIYNYYGDFENLIGAPSRDGVKGGDRNAENAVYFKLMRMPSIDNRRRIGLGSDF